MNTSKVLILIGSLSVLFSGCATTGAVCSAESVEPITIDIVKENDSIYVIKDRNNITSEAIYYATRVSKSEVHATKKKSIFMTWSNVFASNRIKLNLKDNTVRTSEITYKCDENFKKEIEKIDIETIY